MYNLRALGWSSFQELCLMIAREVLGQTVESFLDSNDGGRDGAFSGHWNPTGKEDIAGRFVVQCKFTSRLNHALRAAELSDEVGKVRRLAERGVCDVYVLMTNAGLSGSQAEAIGTLFKDAGAKHVLLFGSTWISQQIHENKRLRMLVPRVYGLGDLSQILDERAYAQARALLESLREDLAKVVVTDAYRRAAAALESHGFVLLIGEPAAGKTTIASLLAMAAVDQWNASVLKLDEPGRVAAHWNPDEPSQFFWLDDVFGVTQYESFLVYGWNRILPQIKTMLGKGAKVVMTSRDYIYNRARADLKDGAFPLLREAQVVIDVHDLSTDEKRQILYNHLKLGRQRREFLTAIKPHLESVAIHPHFIPETARRLAEPVFTVGLDLDAHHIGQFVERREHFLCEVLKGLDADSKAALALIYMRNDRLESPITLQRSEEEAIERLGSDLGGCIMALGALRGSLVLHSRVGTEAMWRFKHPTIGDAYAGILVESPELLGIFIQGSAAGALVQQVTCGDVGIEKAVIIPQALFPMMLAKLSQLSSSRRYKSAHLSVWDADSALQGFLARRCSKDFLALYIAENPDLVAKVSRPGLMLEAASEVDLAVRLHAVSLLPEENRKEFVRIVSEYAINGEDFYALDDVDIRAIYAASEFDELLQRIRAELLPRLGDVRRDWQRNVPSSERADEYMQPLLDAFDTLRHHFEDEVQALLVIEREARSATEWIEENTPEESDSHPRPLGKVEVAERPHGTRSIFDDIDS